jgi:hypothetical protein
MTDPRVGKTRWRELEVEAQEKTRHIIALADEIYQDTEDARMFGIGVLANSIAAAVRGMAQIAEREAKALRKRSK